MADSDTHAATLVPRIPLSQGHGIPQIGFGVWQVPNDEVGPAVTAAIEAGYRSIDTAQGYDNEAGVGEAIAASGVPREDLFVTSKLRPKLMGKDATRKGIEGSLKALGLDYLDMFLIHWPVPALGRYLDTWEAFIDARDDGLIRTIGVSNFLPEHLEAVIARTGVTPAVNQIELHPQFQQRDVRDFHEEMGIAIECYSPLGSGAVLDNEAIAQIAKAHLVSPAQVILRWHLQQGLIAIPKSVTPERIRENLDIFGFALSEQDMAAIAALDDPANGRTGSDPATYNDEF